MLSTRRLAGYSVRRPWLIKGSWIAVFAVALVIAGALLEDVLTTQWNFINKPEYEQGRLLLEDQLRGPERANEIVVVKSTDFTVDQSEFREVVEELTVNIAALGSELVYYKEGVPQVLNPYLAPIPELVSEDRHAALIVIRMTGNIDDASRTIGELHRVVDEADTQSGFSVLVTGDATLSNDFVDISQDDLIKGEAIGIPIALLVLLVIFGSVVASIIPMVLGLLSIIVALGAVSLLGLALDLSVFVTNMVTAMGLAVGIDYSLFVLQRYREERRRGLDKLDAIDKASATASRAVFFSGMTVVLALIGLFFVPTDFFLSMALGAILVVVAAVMASLTLLPAVLGLLGDKVNRLSISPLFRQRGSADDDNEKGFWGRVAGTVMRYPLVSLVISTGLLLAAAAPVLDMHTGLAGVTTMPERARSKAGFIALERQFTLGLVSPVEIVITGQIDSQPVQDAIAGLMASLAAEGVSQQIPIQVSDDRKLALLSIPPASDAWSEQSIAQVRRIRDEHLPAAFAGVEAGVFVTGFTAKSLDFTDISNRLRPIVFAFVLGLSFVLLTVIFRSIVVPVKAVLMNLLSVGATYGLLVLVFQKGVGADLFGFQQVEVIESWIPLFLFAVLFGLSMDYHVFLLSRIRERFDHSGDNRESVAFGIVSTGRIITGAALIMVVVFSGMASGEMVTLEQLGFGLAVAILLDATIVRTVLVPSAMQLLGTANWYLPGFLRWLPDVRVEAE